MAQSQAVFGTYENVEQAERAVETMRSAGFREVDISMLCSDNIGNKDLALDTSTKAPEGAVAGGSAGAVLGGALGWLTGLGVLMIPGAGPFLAAGPLMALLGGVGLGGTLGGLAGALIGSGIPEFEARRYAGQIHGGHVLLSVHCDNQDWANTAAELLRHSGAHDVSRTAEAEAQFDSSDRPHTKRTSADEYEPEFRNNFESFHRELGPYETFAPIYAWGYNMAHDPRFRDQTFEKSEPELKQLFCSANPSLQWETISTLVLFGWEQAGGTIENRFVII